MKPLSMSFVDPKSSITCGIPGAKIELASGVKNVMADINDTIPHFLANPQFNGLAGSSGPSKSTIMGSCSVSSSDVFVLGIDTGAEPFSTSLTIDEVPLAAGQVCTSFDDSTGVGCTEPRLLGISASWPSAAARSMISLLVGEAGLGFDIAKTTNIVKPRPQTRVTQLSRYKCDVYTIAVTVQKARQHPIYIYFCRKPRDRCEKI